MLIRELRLDDEIWWHDMEDLLNYLSPTHLNIVTFAEYMKKRLKRKIITWVAFDAWNEGLRSGLIGTVSLVTEPKLSHDGRKMGMLTDLVVFPEYSGRGVGEALQQRCIQYSRDHNYYKLILTCKPELRGYYEKSGFKEVGIEMRLDLGA